MSGKPPALAKIDDLVSNLRTTMARADDVFSPSMRKQLGQIVSSFLRMTLGGAPFIHPGMVGMAKWGQCCERQARRNFTQLRHWGVVQVVKYPKGGRRASRFVVNFSALRMVLVEMGTNPSVALLEKIRDAGNPDINSDIQGDKSETGNPDICPDTMSAGIHTTKGNASERPKKVTFRVTHPQFSERGGRDV